MLGQINKEYKLNKPVTKNIAHLNIQKKDKNQVSLNYEKVMEISKQYNLDPIKVYEIQSEFECLIEMSKSDESDSGLKDLIGNIDK